ncbi:MAG: DUF423 domain-containing protein [Deltaproteobacteria bacterium]|nr:DUF423 domain-containing protein [Deltaproteobacteria bacterium]
MRRFSSGAFLCAIAVAAGAFGAHGLRDALDSHALELWETASRYLLYAGLALMVIQFSGRTVGHAPGLTEDSSAGRRRLAEGLLLAGGLVFSGTVFALALGAPRWLGAVTPLGGGAMIAGFLVLSWAMPRRSD